MRHFFEFLRKRDGQRTSSTSAALEADWENIAMDVEFQSLLPPKRVGSPENCDEPGDLMRIPVEELRVEPATRIVFYGDPGSIAADRFRFLRMRLREMKRESELRTLLVTSPLPNDGKSTIAVNLATALAERGRCKVLLIEGDLHQASLTTRLSLKPHPGLADCLENGLDPMVAIRRLEPLGWYAMAAGRKLRNPTELLQTEALSGVMQRLHPYFDWILIDSPPVLPLTDALLLKQHADASLMIARAGRTPSEAVEEAITLLGRKHVLGIVLNCAERLGRLYGGDYYNRYYSQIRHTEWTGGEKAEAQGASQVG